MSKEVWVYVIQENTIVIYTFMILIKHYVSYNKNARYMY